MYRRGEAVGGRGEGGGEGGWMMEWGWVEASCRGASRLVGEGANEGGGPGIGDEGWKATEGRQGTRKATIDPWSPSVLPILFLPSTLSSSLWPFFVSAAALSFSRPRHDLTNSLCTFARPFSLGGH